MIKKIKVLNKYKNMDDEMENLLIEFNIPDISSLGLSNDSLNKIINDNIEN
jgi:hypothetical protein